MQLVPSLLSSLLLVVGTTLQLALTLAMLLPMPAPQTAAAIGLMALQVRRRAHASHGLLQRMFGPGCQQLLECSDKLCSGGAVRCIGAMCTRSCSRSRACPLVVQVPGLLLGGAPLSSALVAVICLALADTHVLRRGADVVRSALAGTWVSGVADEDDDARSVGAASAGALVGCLRGATRPFQAACWGRAKVLPSFTGVTGVAPCGTVLL